VDRLTFETLISDTSAKLLHASPLVVSAAIGSALGSVRAFFQADRCVLLGVKADTPFVNIVGASYAEGVTQVGEEINLAELFPWTYRRLVVDRVPVFTRLDEMPPEAALDRANNEQLGIRSALAVPLEAGDLVSHVIVLNAVTADRVWPMEYVPRLRVLGELMVAAMQRQEAFRELQAREANERSNAARLAAAVDSAELGFSERTLADQRVFLDERMRDILGLTDAEDP
jgi:formate hydrogenlyase transcriptional activator